MKGSEFYIEIASRQISKNGEDICGDVFLSRKIQEENRIITVLSDGLGSGVKANVLATLTATMGLNFTVERYPPELTARTILDTLPVDRDRKISYATFTIVDSDADGETRLVNFDNPAPLIVRDRKLLNTNKSIIGINKRAGRKRELIYRTFQARLEDRIILFTDGVSQSGIGTAMYPFGWDEQAIGDWVSRVLEQEPGFRLPICRDGWLNGHMQTIYTKPMTIPRVWSSISDGRAACCSVRGLRTTVPMTSALPIRWSRLPARK